ncbi:MAG: hypothetical protein ACJAVZ_005133 [Afipia broomeae]|jgi:hypothetical protein
MNHKADIPSALFVQPTALTALPAIIVSMALSL